MEERADRYRAEASNLDQLLSERNRLLNSLECAYRASFKKRKTKFDELTDASNGKLRLLLEHAQNYGRYIGKLSDFLKGGSPQISVAQRRLVGEKIGPRKLIELVLQEDFAPHC